MLGEKEIIHRVLSSAGININGNQPWDVIINDDKIYSRILKDGEVGIGEGYMLNEWECQQLDQLMYKVHLADIERKKIMQIALMLVFCRQFYSLKDNIFLLQLFF